MKGTSFSLKHVSSLSLITLCCESNPICHTADVPMSSDRQPASLAADLVLLGSNISCFYPYWFFRSFVLVKCVAYGGCKRPSMRLGCHLARQSDSVEDATNPTLAVNR
jgi:hypothetical protein